MPILRLQPLTNNYFVFKIYRQSQASVILMPIFIATWEAEIGRITFPGQTGQIVCQTPFPN
jgi:hypothetical protein